jgi:hypothetical protein
MSFLTRSALACAALVVPLSTASAADAAPVLTLSTVEDAYRLEAPIGGTSAAWPYTVGNSGDEPLLVSSVTVDREFALATDTCSGAALAPGATCTFAIVIKPTVVGAQSGTLLITSNASPNGAHSPLVGAGTAATPAPAPTPPPAPPSNLVSVSSVKTGKAGAATLGLAFPAAGRYTVTGTAKHRGKTIASVVRRDGVLDGAQSLSVSLAPSKVARAALKRAKTLKLTLAITFTPTGGTARTITQTVIVKR